MAAVRSRRTHALEALAQKFYAEYSYSIPGKGRHIASSVIL